MRSFEVGEQARLLSAADYGETHDVEVVGFHDQFDRVHVRMQNGSLVWASPRRLIRPPLGLV